MRPAVIRPPVWSISRVMLSAVTDLPDPDFAYDRQRLALGNMQIERRAPRSRGPLLGGERDAQALDVEQLPGLGQRRILR